MSQLTSIRAGKGGGLRSLMRRAAVAAGAAVVLLGAAVWAAGPAAAIPGPAVLYAYAAGAAVSPTSCPQDTTGTPSNECSLSEALSLANPGDTIDLATPGGTAHYVGNWTVTTNFTSNTTPVTIQPAPGLASPPVLDGNKGASTGCTTAACDGPVLTVPSGEYLALTGLTIANGNNTAGGFPMGGGLDNAGTVTITGSTFTGNSATWDGGAIDNADNQGDGSVTVTASTFTGNTARLGGAIASGEWGGFGTATVTASTFTGNTTRIGGGNGLGGYGGAISIGYGGNGTATVTASTFSGNTAQAAGGAIASGGNGGGGTMTVAGDLFNGSCTRGVGPWTDGGYNAGTNKTCFASTPAAGDKSGSAVGSDLQTGLTGNGGPTQTIKPTTGNPAIGLIPDPTTITLGSNQVALCPATDQRGYPSAASTACDAGAVQTSGSPPALALKDSAAPASFYAAGQQITYSYQVANTGTGTLSGISVTDPAVPGASCPAATLSPGTSETCTGTYTTTAPDLAAGTITGTATAAAATANGVPVTSPTATVTVPKGWPPMVTGVFRPAVGAAEGYYLGVTGNTWSVFVTHPGTAKVAFTGHVSVPAGTLGHLSVINPTAGHQLSTTGKVITFTLPDYGKVTGFSFTTTAKVSSISLTLDIGGHPATASQINLGGTPTNPGSGSPLTYTR